MPELVPVAGDTVEAAQRVFEAAKAAVLAQYRETSLPGVSGAAARSSTAVRFAEPSPPDPRPPARRGRILVFTAGSALVLGALAWWLSAAL